MSFYHAFQPCPRMKKLFDAGYRFQGARPIIGVKPFPETGRKDADEIIDVNGPHQLDIDTDAAPRRKGTHHDLARVGYTDVGMLDTTDLRPAEPVSVDEPAGDKTRQSTNEIRQEIYRRIPQPSVDLADEAPDSPRLAFREKPHRTGWKLARAFTQVRPTYADNGPVPCFGARLAVDDRVLVQVTGFYFSAFFMDVCFLASSTPFSYCS